MEFLKDYAIETKPCRYGMMSFFKNDTIVSLSLKEYGEWAQLEIDFLLDLIASGDTVLDIGAFLGTHTLAFARHVGTSGKIYAFEPHPVFFNVLKKNVEQNTFNNVMLFNAAVSNRVVLTDTMDEIDVNDICNFGESSLSSIKAKLTPAAKRHKINVTTIDQQAISGCTLIKIDVEGMESNVLRGGRHTLRASRPIVFAECNSLEHGWQALAFMKEEGYCAYLLNEEAYNPQNFRQNQQNIFGHAREAGLVFFPSERRSEARHRLRPYPRLIPISCLDDLALGLLKKPQYKYEVMAKTKAASVLGVGFWANEPEAEQLRIEAAQSSEKEQQIHDLSLHLEEKDGLAQDRGREIAELRSQINSMQQTIGWKALERVRRLIPPKSRRQALYLIFRRATKVRPQEGPRALVRKAARKVSMAIHRQAGPN